MNVKPHLWLIRFIGVIVPRRLRADWRQEWQAELRYREMMLADWDKLNWKTNRSVSPQSRRVLGCVGCCNHKDWRTRCFKTCVTACECW